MVVQTPRDDSPQLLGQKGGQRQWVGDGHACDHSLTGGHSIYRHGSWAGYPRISQRDLSTMNVDLEPLDEFLLSDRAPENSMGLSDLDGFLTGIVIGPDLIMPSEWLPIIWGGDDPAFASTEEAKAIIGTIMGRYNEIITELDAGPDAFAPLFWDGSEGQVIVSDWAAGFMDAVKLRPKAWEPLIKDKDGRVLIMPLLVLGADDPDHPPFGSRPLPDNEVQQLLQDGHNIIPECVLAIHLFWREHRAQPAPKASRMSRGPKDLRAR